MMKLHNWHIQLVHFWALAGERRGCEGPRRRAEEAGCPHRVLQQEGGRASKAARTSVCQVRQHNEGMVWPKFSHFFQVWRRVHWCWEHCKEVDFCDLGVGQHWGSGAAKNEKLYKGNIKFVLQVKLLRAELEDQEKSLKASVAAQVQNDLLVETNYNLWIGTGEKSPRELGCSSTSWTKTHWGAWYSPTMF